MRKITLLLVLFSFQLLSAQHVFDINWGSEINTVIANPIIEIGDTVRWTWTDSSPKSVTSTNEAVESFDSGILSGQNKQYTYTFNQIGISEFRNDANPALSGKVTVVQRLSSADKFAKNLSFYPNPVESDLRILSLFKLDHYQIFNVLGSMIAEGKANAGNTRIDMSNMTSGLYFVKVFSKDLQATLKVAKR